MNTFIVIQVDGEADRWARFTALTADQAVEVATRHWSLDLAPTRFGVINVDDLDNRCIEWFDVQPPTTRWTITKVTS